MNKLEKEFIPYEQALALKELGFDEPCFGYYYTLNGKDWEFGENESYNLLDEFYNIGPKFTLIAPLYQQCWRWFREKYNLLGIVGYCDDNSGKFMSIIDKINEDIDYDMNPRDSYEEAELACLNKLIEICKNEQ